MVNLDFRTNKPQLFRDLGGEHTAVYMGLCVVCHCRTYDHEGGADPRGMLGLRVYTPYVAEYYGMVGPDVVACWGCKENDGDTSRKGLGIAKSRWMAQS